MPGFYVLGDKERIILKVRLSISIQLLKHNKCASISSIELTKILIFDRDGLLVAMESLKALERLSTLPKDKAVDISRVVYAGHSRGGHGALLLGVKLPDLSCGIVASNGWIRREYYADANQFLNTI